LKKLKQHTKVDKTTKKNYLYNAMLDKTKRKHNQERGDDDK